MIYFSYVYICVNLHGVCAHAYSPRRQEEGADSPGAGVTGNYDPTDMGAGNQAQGLLKGNNRASPAPICMFLKASAF